MKEIIICGVAYPVSFGIRTMKVAAKTLGGEFGELATGAIAIDAGLDMMIEIARVAMNEGARKSGVDKRYSEDDVIDLFDSEPTMLDQVSTLFGEATQLDDKKLGELGESSPRTPQNPPTDERERP